MQRTRSVYMTVGVAALGYFVDIYDLLLFGIVRGPSLAAIGVSEADMMTVGVRLLNFQMAGMLLGGIIWGVLGDRRGRKEVLFGSILLYSISNILNAFVHSPDTYAWLRFFAGVGLAGELGAAVTLVSELMSRASRGVGTTLVASFGILGAVMASFIGDYFSWQTAYLIGGFMGLGLLTLRAGLHESEMFHAMRRGVQTRAFVPRALLRPANFGRYLCCILIGVPIWFVIGVLITFAPELARELSVQEAVTGSNAIMWAYLGLSVGDLSAGLLSQRWRSRRRAVFAFLCLTAGLILTYISVRGWSAREFYVLCAGLGFSVGYWSVFVTIAAEQFGTDVRATVATTVPNFVRGSVLPVTWAVQTWRGSLGILPTLSAVGFAVLSLALVALYFLPETYGKDLNYAEAPSSSGLNVAPASLNGIQS